MQCIIKIVQLGDYGTRQETENKDSNIWNILFCDINVLFGVYQRRVHRVS